MRVDPPSTVENSWFSSPREPQRTVHPLVALSLAIGLALTAGWLGGWETAVTVLVAVLNLFGSDKPLKGNRE